MLTQFGHESLKASNLEQGFLCQQNRCILEMIFFLYDQTISFHVDLERSAALAAFVFPQRPAHSPNSC